MDYIAVKDLKTPRLVREKLRREKELLLTSDGKPVAVLVDVASEDDPETMMKAIRDARSRIALSRIREASRQGGMDKMKMADIDAEVAQVRAGRRSTR